MQLWDRLCHLLRMRQISVEDVSNKVNSRLVLVSCLVACLAHGSSTRYHLFIISTAKLRLLSSDSPSSCCLLRVTHKVTCQVLYFAACKAWTWIQHRQTCLHRGLSLLSLVHHCCSQGLRECMQGGMELRVLHAAAKKVTWYGQWGYNYGRGAFNITHSK